MAPLYLDRMLSNYIFILRKKAISSICLNEIPDISTILYRDFNCDGSSDIFQEEDWTFTITGHSNKEWKFGWLYGKINV